MCEKNMLIIVTVPVLFQNSWDFACCIAIAEAFRMNDIVIVGNTTVLSHLLVISGKEQMSLIAVA